MEQMWWSDVPRYALTRPPRGPHYCTSRGMQNAESRNSESKMPTSCDCFMKVRNANMAVTIANKDCTAPKAKSGPCHAIRP